MQEPPHDPEPDLRLARAGASPADIYRQSRAGGATPLEGARLIQQVCGLSQEESLAVMRQVEWEPRLARYGPLRAAGAPAHEIYRQARSDGLSPTEGIQVLRGLFDYTLQQAAAVMRQVEGLPPLPYQEPLESAEELRQALRRDLGFCGCGEGDEALFLLRDLLRFARDRYAAGWDEATRERETATVFARLAYQEAPGAATWLLYILDFHEVIWHGFTIGDFGITSKGEWLLQALERFYPGSAGTAVSLPSE